MPGGVSVIWFIVTCVITVGNRAGLTRAATLKFGCVWRSSISATIPKVQEVSARCREGHIFWYYPSGELTVQFSTDVNRQEFELCLKANDNYHMETIHSGQRVISNPTSGNETCVSSEGGKKALKFQAPTRKVYFTDIYYVITPRET